MTEAGELFLCARRIGCGNAVGEHQQCRRRRTQVEGADRPVVAQLRGDDGGADKDKTRKCRGKGESAHTEVLLIRCPNLHAPGGARRVRYKLRALMHTRPSRRSTVESAHAT